MQLRTRTVVSFALLCCALVARAGDAVVFTPEQLPHVSGVVRTYTLIPRGAVDGFFLDDGTQVLTAPPLSARVLQVAPRGARLTVYGLKAREGTLILALAVANADSHESVVLGDIPLLLALGAPLPEHHGAPAADSTAAGSAASPNVTLQGVVQRPIYGPRATVSGALLADGTVLRIASSAAERAAPWLTTGALLVVQGEASDSAQGRLVLVNALGPSAQQLVKLAPWDGPR